MRRGATGRYITKSIGGEEVRAFVPYPLPPRPPITLESGRHVLLEQALLALGRLDSLSALLPDTSLLIYAYVRKEAVLSSQIEGTQSTLSDLLLFELGAAPGAPVDDVVEVSSYVSAMTHGLQRLRDDFPLSNRLLSEIHAVLLSRGRGSDKQPGEFRTSQNWVGGTRPGNALFVPPPPENLAECLTDLERFLHSKDNLVPTVIKTGLAHVQFETIHPFLDGNGRVGRLLITFLLCHGRVLSQPTLYLSLYFKQHRDEYYRLLNQIRDEGDWEAWLTFFLEGVLRTADGAVSTSQRLMALFAEDQRRIQKQGRKTGSALQVHQALKARPITSLQEVTERTGLSFPTASSSMDLLGNLGVVKELTGGRRNRLFAYQDYLTILNEGTEPL